MKSIYSTIFAISMLTLIVACGGGNDSVRDQARQSLDVPSAPAAPSVANNSGQPTPPATSNAAASGVAHYTCPNNCAGSGGATQENCPVCGTQYVHNQAYHSQAAPSQPATTTTSTPATPTTPEPAQNAAGVWHYTCPAGCAGGGGSAVACSSCGATLAHNTGYHN